MDVLETALSRVREYPTLVALLQIVANMHKACTLECGAELTCLCVARDQTSEPIVRDKDAGDYLSLAEVLEAGLAEDCKLADSTRWCLIGVRLRENLCMVQEHEFDSTDGALMHADRNLHICVDRDIVDVLEAGWVFGKVPCHTLAIAVIVRGNHDDVLAKVGEANGKFINHNSKTAYCRPAA